MLTSHEHIAENRRYWDATAEYWIAGGEHAWASSAPFWGIWHLPEARLGLLPKDMRGMTAIELGCGTGYVSGWMARRGAKVVGVDLSAAQLSTARRLAYEHASPVHLVNANAEAVPFPTRTFDFAISEYGAALWCDPRAWLPEAHRLLRGDGRLVFLSGHPLAALCIHPEGSGVDDRLHRDARTLHRLDWRNAVVDPGGIEFNLMHSEWLALFRETGFVVEDYLELYAPPDAEGVAFGVRAEWAQRFPCEQVWKLRKR